MQKSFLLCCRPGYGRGFSVPHGDLRRSLYNPFPVWYNDVYSQSLNNQGEAYVLSYTALDAMRKKNLERFGRDLGPFCPVPYPGEETGTDLKSAALRFLDRRCSGLRFDPEKEKEEARTGQYLGTSLFPDQIPYNMQMDIDRLCLKNELAKFIDSGVAEDAYTVYYCYLDMFMGEFGESQKMVEMLSEFESNASSLLMKHRDHYSHSVYVFALGLAIYDMNPAFRRTFCDFYHLPGGPEDPASAAFFLEYWGLTSLFHDIGYPFEIPFEQVLAYFEVDSKKRGKGSLYMAYHDVDRFVAVGEKDGAALSRLYGRSFSTVEELLAYAVTQQLGAAYDISADHLLDVICSKPTHPEKNGYYMDHAFFSAVRLYQELVSVRPAERLSAVQIDALTAIMLHNSLYKFAIAFYKDKEKHKAPLKAEFHPLAWLLMLCDELQCWDRTAYGRNTRTELHPMSAEFDFSGPSVTVTYYFDEEEHEKIEEYEKQYALWKQKADGSDAPRLKDYSDMAAEEERFRKDIEKIVDLSGFPLRVSASRRPVNRTIKHTWLSSSNFLHIYDFAVALNARYSYQGKEDQVTTEQLEQDFDSMSLEYKLLNINQVRNFARYLNAIDCFYTDRPVDFDMLHEFYDYMTAVFAPMEHARWIHDHQQAGWMPGDEYESLPVSGDEVTARRALREQLRRHKLTMAVGATDEEIQAHYESLPPEEQGKDYLPFNSMLKLLHKYDGLRIYRLDRI